MHTRVVELELWSLPLSEKVPMDGKLVAKRCRHETGLPSKAVLGLNFVPGQEDVRELKEALARGQEEVAEFESFCLKRDLSKDPANEQSAAEFLVYVQGQSLAWLHLPADPSGLEMAQILTRWAQANGMQIRDGASTYEPLSNAQVFALWRGAALYLPDDPSSE